MEYLSYVFTVISVILYSIVYLPQIKLMYTTKSSQGLSLTMMLLWTQADVLSLVASIISNLQLGIIILGWYDFAIGTFTTILAFVYKRDKNLYETTFVLCSVLVNTVTCILLTCLVREPNYPIGEALGWLTSAIYIIGRLPQLYLNVKRKSTEGLSFWMYLLSFLGNVFYLCSIFTYSLESVYIRTILPWIVLTCSTIALDIVLFAQYFVYYNSNKSTKIASKEESESCC